jgi:hypothetical protein
LVSGTTNALSFVPEVIGTRKFDNRANLAGQVKFSGCSDTNGGTGVAKGETGNNWQSGESLSITRLTAADG